jgi:putative ABC transport system permease protein
MDSLWKDVRYAVRTIAKSPAVSVVAILALAAGIGANTAIFSVVNAVLLSPLPYAEPDRLVSVWGGRVGDEHERSSISYADFDDWRRQNRSFERMAVWNYKQQILRAGSEPVPLRGIIASADLLPMLGVQPAFGRFFTAEEDRAGAPDVVVLGYKAWKEQFNANPDVVGTSVMLGSKGVTIVGVMPEKFVFPANWSRVDYIAPAEPAIGKLAQQRSSQFIKCVAQLRRGVTVDEARSELATMCQQLAVAYPDTNTNRMAWMAPMHEDLVGDTRPALLILLGAVGLVLLIACANVANLLFARATARRREISIRAALGAGRARIVRQLLVESLLLAIVGAVAGMLLAVWGLDALVKFSPGDIPRLRNAGLDGSVLAFTAVITLVTTIAAGLAPALQLSTPSLSDALKEGSRGSTEGAGARRTRSALVAVQFALSVMLLVGAGLLVRSFLELRNVNPGFEPEGVFTVSLNPGPTTYPEADDRNRYFRQTLDTVRAAPGVDSAALIAPLPFSGWEMSTSFTVDGKPMPAPGDEPSADIRYVSSDYFTTMKIPVVRGRAFDERDTKESTPVAVVNETFARKFFPNEEAVGQHLTVGADPTDNPNPPSREIVGVVGDAYHESLDAKPGPEYYIPYTQDDGATYWVAARGAGVTAAGLREAVRSVDRNIYIEAPEPLTENIGDSINRQRFNTLLLGLFAAVALLLATVGIYGVMSYAVARRTHDIGIRMALGASAGRIMREVVGQGIGMALAGTAVGLAGAFALCRALESLLFGVTATDPVTFAIVTGVLLAVALAACFIPARWAARVDPMIALRDE